MIVILAPYYFSHKLAIQLCGATALVCPFDPKSLFPDWAVLEELILTRRPKMVDLCPNGILIQLFAAAFYSSKLCQTKIITDDFRLSSQHHPILGVSCGTKPALLACLPPAKS